MRDMKKRMHAIVHGRVQGVFFRETTRQQALRLGLQGWVRNLANGTVETEFQGEEKAVGQMLDWLSVGSSLSSVTRVDSREKPVVEEEVDFDITW